MGGNLAERPEEKCREVSILFWFLLPNIFAVWISKVWLKLFEKCATIISSSIVKITACVNVCARECWQNSHSSNHCSALVISQEVFPITYSKLKFEIPRGFLHIFFIFLTSQGGYWFELLFAEQEDLVSMTTLPSCFFSLQVEGGTTENLPN